MEYSASLISKQFSELAGIVNDHRKRWSGHDDECQHVLHLANEIADYCEGQLRGVEGLPPFHFKRDSFIQACGFHFVDGEGWRERTHRDR